MKAGICHQLQAGTNASDVDYFNKIFLKYLGIGCVTIEIFYDTFIRYESFFFPFI